MTILDPLTADYAFAAAVDATGAYMAGTETGDSRSLAVTAEVGSVQSTAAVFLPVRR
jgi:hypothetical protein